MAVANASYRTAPPPPPSLLRSKLLAMPNLLSSSRCPKVVPHTSQERYIQGGIVSSIGEVLTNFVRVLPMASRRPPSLVVSLPLTTSVPLLQPTVSQLSCTPTTAPRSFSHGWMVLWMPTRSTSRSTASLCSPAT